MFDLEMVKRNFPFENKFGQISGPRQFDQNFILENLKKFHQDFLKHFKTKHFQKFFFCKKLKMSCLMEKW